MKITSNPSNNIAKLYQSQQTQFERAEKAGDTTAAKHDSLQLSDQAKRIHELISTTKDLPDVREEKIAQIKAELANQTYNVSAAQLAAKMLGDDHE
jgi:negative regulator of flagellin synthesis FlgM